MDEFDNKSRKDKFEKRRKNTKSISVLIVVGAILVIMLPIVLIFGGGEGDQSVSSDVVISNPESTGETTAAANEGLEPLEEESTDQEENSESADEEGNEEGNEDENNEDAELEETKPTDENAVEAYTADWEPIGTEQEGQHTTNYNDGSQDRQEIREAIVQITGLNPDDMIEHWIGNGGDQQVIATVSDSSQAEIYRVFLTWVDGEGWMPTQLEVLDEVVY